MWKFTSSVIASIGGLKKSPSKPSCSDCSDDENNSNISREEGLECPICWESFNIVENVPYVLWCGHTLCKNCVLGLQTASLNFPSKQIKVPFLISCPWCQLLSFRLVCGGNLKFPRKNFFLLWMVESLTGDRARFVSSQENHQLLCSPKANNVAPRRFQTTRNLTQTPSNSAHVGNTVERPQISLSKSLDMFIDLLSKFPLVIVFLLILFFVIPSSAIVLIVYFLLTAFFAVPSILVLYFAYPVLSWLIKEITS